MCSGDEGLLLKEHFMLYKNDALSLKTPARICVGEGTETILAKNK